MGSRLDTPHNLLGLVQDADDGGKDAVFDAVGAGDRGVQAAHGLGLGVPEPGTVKPGQELPAGAAAIAHAARAAGRLIVDDAVLAGAGAAQQLSRNGHLGGGCGVVARRPACLSLWWRRFLLGRQWWWRFLLGRR